MPKLVIESDVSKTMQNLGHYNLKQLIMKQLQKYKAE